MSKKKTKVKPVKHLKLLPFQYFLLKRKGSNIWWTDQLFPTGERAKEYFSNVCRKNGWEFDFEDYELILVRVSPLPN
jgi:hypothetical protein